MVCVEGEEIGRVSDAEMFADESGSGVTTLVVGLQLAGVLAGGAQESRSEQEDGEEGGEGGEGGNHRNWLVRLTLSQVLHRIYTHYDMLVLPIISPPVKRAR